MITFDHLLPTGGARPACDGRCDGVVTPRRGAKALKLKTCDSVTAWKEVIRV
jgi:hypothetical protein